MTNMNTQHAITIEDLHPMTRTFLTVVCARRGGVLAALNSLDGLAYAYIRLSGFEMEAGFELHQSVDEDLETLQKAIAARAGTPAGAAAALVREIWKPAGTAACR